MAWRSWSCEIGFRNGAPDSGSTVEAACPAHMPAKQSACSSARTAPEVGPVVPSFECCR